MGECGRVTSGKRLALPVPEGAKGAEEVQRLYAARLPLGHFATLIAPCAKKSRPLHQLTSGVSGLDRHFYLLGFGSVESHMKMFWDFFWLHCKSQRPDAMP